MMLLTAFLTLLLTSLILFYFAPGLLISSGVFAAMWLATGLFAPAMLHPVALILLAAGIALLNVRPIRSRIISAPAYKALAKVMPTMSSTEREALEAGTAWWDADLFRGKPDWEKFSNIKLPTLTDKEQSFIDNEVEELCNMLDEWEIQHYHKDLPEPVWQFLKDKGFFSLIIPEKFGGRDFSPYAQSRVMSKIASRSITAAVTAMVPNSLGPGELLMKYGTDEQKANYLPRILSGDDVWCQGYSEPGAGSDLASLSTSAVRDGDDYVINRDAWFVVGVPIWFSAALSDGTPEGMKEAFFLTGLFMSAWVIAYGAVQAYAPKMLRASARALEEMSARAWVWAALLALILAPMAAAAWAFGAGPEFAPVLVLGLLGFGAAFAVNSSLHSYLILAFSSAGRVTMDVGFYYMSNAAGRLLGTLLSGIGYQIGGLGGCLGAAALMAGLSALAARRLRQVEGAAAAA